MRWDSFERLQFVDSFRMPWWATETPTTKVTCDYMDEKKVTNHLELSQMRINWGSRNLRSERNKWQQQSTTGWRVIPNATRRVGRFVKAGMGHMGRRNRG